MNLVCATERSILFSSASQQARVATEDWFGAQGYCLACPSRSLETTKPNSKASDFVCRDCHQSYELKSSTLASKSRVVDGAYKTMLERIASDDPPSLILLQYSKGGEGSERIWNVRNLTAIHPVFLTPSIVEPRAPLSQGARRAGWQGCNLRIDRIPYEGKIALVDNGVVTDQGAVRRLYASSQRLSVIAPNSRGWTALVLNIVRGLGREAFDIRDIYCHKQVLQEVFPHNQNIEAKIRQQLQVLRDLGYLRFTGNGKYEVVG